MIRYNYRFSQTGRRRNQSGWMFRDRRNIIEYRFGEIDFGNQSTNQSGSTSQLQVVAVDSNISLNTRSHHTNEYDLTVGQTGKNREFLVVRRGQTFDLDIEFSRVYDKKQDDLRLVFQFGSTPDARKKSHVEFILSDEDLPGEWGAFIKSTTGNSVMVGIITPPDCYVGKWKLKIDVVKKDDTDESVYRYSHPDPIYLIFNPWCKDDSVYMDDTKLLKEYILNETGRIYAGSYKRISPKPWAFGQFEGDILDCALYLLDQKSNLPAHQRGNPVSIVRKISALVNAPDDGGVLVGNWSGDYTGGTSPLDWSGSVAILEQYYRYKEPVQFGQCWVFSGLVTTLCRTLGIPVRSVTNFASAHDTDGSITIDNNYDHTGKPMEDMNDDSVWNFHVWNDVWMARPDLPTGNGGWQAIDATPQETSEGVFCMGPMSLNAIRNGDVNLPYDGAFVFAEVNADKVHWLHRKDGTAQIVRKESNSVGRYISTKEVNGKGREDITHLYKQPENSNEERAAVLKANLKSTRHDVYDTGVKDVEYELITTPDTHVGETVVVQLNIKNNSDEVRTVEGRIHISSMYYTGLHYKDIQDVPVHEEAKPKTEEYVTVKIGANQYLDKLADHCMLKISCFVNVEETKQAYTETDELRLRKPHLTVKAPVKGVVGKRINVEISFTNPLPVTLTGCELKIEGPGLQKPLILKQSDVGAKQTYAGSFELTPAKIGNREMLVSFNALQLRSINAAHDITVQ